jgi:protein NirF
LRLVLAASAFALAGCIGPGAVPAGPDAAGVAAARPAVVRGTGDLGVIIERANGSVLLVETTTRTRIGRIEGLGDLSHASVNFSRDGRHAYVFGRDGGLTKIDLLEARIVRRVMQSGNSIGGAISQDGRLVAVSNYTPGGVKVFDAGTLDLVAEIPAATGPDGRRSKVVGLVDAPGSRFVFSLFEAGEIWVADVTKPDAPAIERHARAGREPYDAMITADGRWYAAGLFGEDGVALLDLWNTQGGVRRVLAEHGRKGEKMPVYKMPHLEGWALAGSELFLPAVGRAEVVIADAATWQERARIAVHGQPVFVVARPDARQVWVNFAYPDNDVVQVIDVPSRRVVKTLTPGKAVLHMEFTPRGEHAWVSARDSDRVAIYDTRTLAEIGSLPASRPSGIFFTARAHRIGQ